MTYLDYANASNKAVKDASLRVHNQHRENAGLKPLKWDNGLENMATRYSEKLGRETRCSQLRHSEGRGNVGENLYMISTNSIKAGKLAESGSESWYNEVKDYRYPGNADYQKCPKNGMIGHLTQMMWAKSTKIGFTNSGLLFLLSV